MPADKGKRKLKVVEAGGSNFEMGFQYAQQVIQIFGPWLMRRKAGRVFTEDERDCIRQWEAQIRQFAPEILEMCRGWSTGATDAGVRAKSPAKSPARVLP